MAVEAYANFPEKEAFFLNGFERISGVSSLRNQIIEGVTETEIRNSWTQDLEKFKKLRTQYLLYP